MNQSLDVHTRPKRFFANLVLLCMTPFNPPTKADAVIVRWLAAHRAITAEPNVRDFYARRFTALAARKGADEIAVFL